MPLGNNWTHEQGLIDYLIEKFDKLRNALDTKDGELVAQMLEEIAEDGYPELASGILQTLVSAGLERVFLIAVLGLDANRAG